MAGKNFSEKHRILYYEGDQNAHVTLPMLVNMMVLASEDQSELLGVGPKKMSTTGLGWVVTQYQIKIKKMPKINEEVTISTEAINHNAYFCQRDFWISDKEGNELVHATSIFVMMDLQKRKMQKLIPEILEPYESEEVKQIIRLPKIIEPEDGEKLSHQYSVRYLDIDQNRHVNNSRYFEWMINTLDDEVLTNNFPSEVNVRYHVEVQPGAMINSKAIRSGSQGDFRTNHKIFVDDTLCTEANIEWQSYLE
ncbi:acyl-[acyl-carrier-protein] thioesterase [Pediococcus claussenii]|uniref:Oleoyl-[acyl-carrier protein] thioesterase n=1 Tax=Pediococcus claussenii (strain ATCC BAA-344 / DSM 14800 / JCM 18046 / KCTC 3811 / LMG 21948 / P06) TaxID=701521 RepID=G8PBY7_PEDCP|nr:acyl-ACP thioesterase domain-containing protein [Pediococcus claussenii]AEV94806.1 oleoyl-[acyl-carrier protein] thioesterase [Pediococcus claussenii ATCC BAA-344]ANZ70003.1 acyl-ACP thioesterase [Pediococcus claussenii]ANZ71818.1 acyl-ACP thioesterase [Pediococcus claussenii]KRN20985.1 fat protein [Pediococcus claussenii]